MAWIEDNVRLHKCDLPEWYGGIVESAGALWGCEKCHRVHRVISVYTKFDENNKPSKVTYGWQLAKGLVYVEEKLEDA